ncbi:MAG: ParA family protein [Beijerinckiaceae bacterium]|nr:ParA family protein [Beijerinckiaceae bacterium]
MRTIVFAAHKGGCGRSTLAICLAVAAQEAGERVVVLDMDPKNCAVRWGSKRMDPSLPVRAISPAGLNRALSLAAKRNASLVLIDTPVLESTAAMAAVNAAELSIIPARPARFDIWASEVTGRRLNLMNKKFVYLLNQCPPRRSALRVKDGIATLEATGNFVFPCIGSRGDFLEAAASGKGVTEVNPKGGAAVEIRSLWFALAFWLQPPPIAG